MFNFFVVAGFYAMLFFWCFVYSLLLQYVDHYGDIWWWLLRITTDYFLLSYRILVKDNLM